MTGHRWASSRVPTPEMVTRADELKLMREATTAIKADVAQKTREFIGELRKLGIPVRDIAYLLDLSPQRVSQIRGES